MSKSKTSVYQGDKTLRELLAEVLIICKWRKPKGRLPEYEIIEKSSREFFRKGNTIPSRMGSFIGITTLKRLFEDEVYTKQFDIRILDILTWLAGYESWSEYVDKRSIWESSIEQFLDADELEVGQVLILGSEHSRYIKLEYLDELEFKILEYKGRGDKKEGDIIIAKWFEIIEPNFKDHQNTEIDIIGLIDILDSGTEVNERDHLYYTRLYL